MKKSRDFRKQRSGRRRFGAAKDSNPLKIFRQFFEAPTVVARTAQFLHAIIGVTVHESGASAPAQPHRPPHPVPQPGARRTAPAELATKKRAMSERLRHRASDVANHPGSRFDSLVGTCLPSGCSLPVLPACIAGLALPIGRNRQIQTIRRRRFGSASAMRCIPSSDVTKTRSRSLACAHCHKSFSSI